MSDLKKSDFDVRKAVACSGQTGYYKQFTWQQRLLNANYLNSIAYNYPENNPPRFDRTAFRITSMKYQ